MSVNGLSVNINGINYTIKEYNPETKEGTLEQIAPEGGEGLKIQVAKNYNGGGFTDWYLPTKGELNQVYENLVKTGILQDDTWHWSSSELNINRYAYYQSFSDGLQDYDLKNFTNSVRAIRAFSN